MVKRTLLTLALCGLTGTFVLPVSAQEYSFQYFGYDQGLTNLAAKNLFQDRTGFIWVGTENGVFRYEGVRFRKFGEKEGLGLSVTASIGEAPDGSVLVGKPQGLYRLRAEHFEQVALPGNKTGVWGYNGIVRDRDRTWIATEFGLVSIKMGAGESLVVETGPQPPSPDLARASSVFLDGNTIWWGCGTALCRSVSGKVTATGAAAGLGPTAITSILKDPAGNLWIVQNRHLRVLHPGSERFEEPEIALPAIGMGSPVIDSDGRLLVPTTEGLAIRDSNGFRMVGRSSGLLPPVYSVLQDREGAVWLGLAGRGLAKWLGYSQWESFNAQSGLTGETVYEILPRADGTVWVGTEAGFFRGRRGSNEQWVWRPIRSVGPIPVHVVQAGPNGKLWLGSDSSGVGLFDPGTEKVKWFSAKDGLIGQSVWTVLTDRAGALWAGSDKGLYRAPPGTTTFHRVEETANEGANLLRFFTVIEAPNGDIWAGSAAGVWRYSGGNWTHFTTRNGLRSQAVIALAADKNGDLWIGYRLTGTITRLRFSATGKAEFQNFDPSAGQPVEITYFLGFDARGRLWAGTNQGILMRDDQSRWYQYDHHDGLIWDDCDLHGFAAEPDGHIWIGTSAGLSHFLPRDAPAESEPPRTVFTSVVSGKTAFDPAHSFTLESSSNSLIARFTALRFGRERDILFRYRLDPSAAWRETPYRELEFPAMPPGKYHLEVEARDTLSEYSSVPATFDFRIKPPLWREWWFIAGCAIGGILLGALILRRRSIREEAIRRALENAVAERTRELSHQYRHDVLTGLPNRLLFGERLHRELLTARRDRNRVAVLFIDVDRFKRINDTWGHHTGDLFLKEIAGRLSSGLRAGETIARIGGDEFIVLIPGLRERYEAERRGWDLLNTLEAPLQVESKNVFATMSVGISTFPDDALESGALMAAADAAMYRAKAEGKNQVQLFEAGMTEAASRPQNIEDRLREALKDGGFRLRYQAQYTLDGRLAGFEALLRIQGMERELGPGEFIPIAEETGLIVEMGAWALREACLQMKIWQQSGFPDIRIAVNVSVVQLAHAGFEAYLVRTIGETGIDPSHLELELTETVPVENTDASAHLLNRIRERGIQVALDDFGTGFSPMQYLHELPVDAVKIDQVFIRNLDAEPSSVPLVEGMVKLAKTLSLKVVAEGVETEAQFEILRQIGFDLAQGYLLSHPVTASEAEDLLRAGNLVRV